ncbi:IS110 family transposase [Jiangella ureilytica]|uniref:IS110 family transposase n=1 Tax=Jiangella ureilytica TaxID=2530374 RepID=UPI00193E5C9A|nr:transposase [Jiangella ureilytica]
MSIEKHGVVIGVDPHKLSATIEVVDQREQILGCGRFSTDKAGYQAMRRYVQDWPHRVWAFEGSNGAGRPLAQRLLADGEAVADLPAKLAARARLLDTSHGRKTDAHDAQLGGRCSGALQGVARARRRRPAGGVTDAVGSP